MKEFFLLKAENDTQLNWLLVHENAVFIYYFFMRKPATVLINSLPLHMISMLLM